MNHIFQVMRIDTSIVIDSFSFIRFRYYKQLYIRSTVVVAFCAGLYTEKYVVQIFSNDAFI